MTEYPYDEISRKIMAEDLQRMFKLILENPSDDFETTINYKMMLLIIEKNIIFPIINVASKDTQIPYNMLEIRDIMVGQMMLELHHDELISFKGLDYTTPDAFITTLLINPEKILPPGVVLIKDNYLLSYELASKMYKEVLKPYYENNKIEYTQNNLPISKQEIEFMQKYKEYRKNNELKKKLNN